MDAINLYVLCQAIDLDNFGDYKDTLTKSGNRLAVDVYKRQMHI